MNVAIFGSSAPSDPKTYRTRNLDIFQRFCRDLGTWIVENGHRLLVESDQEGTADREAAAAAAETSGSPGRVEVFWRAGAAHREQPPFDQHPNREAFRVTRVADALLGAVHHKMLRAADAVIAIGGGRNTYNVALAAAFTKARLLPVGTFGGAAEILLNLQDELTSQTPARLPSRDIVGGLKSPSADVALKAVIDDLLDYPRIMIVHGRGGDHDLVEDLLKNECGVRTATILAKQPVTGRTIVDEFAHHAKRSEAAVVLFTPNDLAAVTVDPRGSPLKPKARRMRARQNVVLEYGWFWGVIGRERTLMLVKEDLEIPSDLHGLRYHQYTSTPHEVLSQLKEFVASVRGRA